MILANTTSYTANPYFDNNFFEFFGTLASRIFAFISGAHLQLAADELQILVLALIAISASVVGTFLVLRKMTMLTNALSHTILTGVVFAYLFYDLMKSGQRFDGADLHFSTLLPDEKLLLGAALFMAFLTTFLTQFLVTKMKLKEDASCGLVFTFLFAVGVIVVTLLSRNAHVGAELLMGNADVLHSDDLAFQFKVTLVNLALIFVLYRAYFVTTFDPIFSHVLGISSLFFGYLLMGQAAITSIAAFRAVGVLLVLAFFVGPPLIVRLWTCRLKPLLMLSFCVGTFVALLGVALSRHLLSYYALPVSTSALIVSLIALIYCGALILKSFVVNTKRF